MPNIQIYSPDVPNKNITLRNPNGQFTASGGVSFQTPALLANALEIFAATAIRRFRSPR